MIKITRRNWIGWLSASVILAILLGGFFSALISKGIDSSETAGWVQAIGSIAAILAAIYVMNEQHRNATRVADAAARDARANLLIAARTTGSEVMSVVGTMMRSIGARDFGEPAILIYCSADLRDILDSANLIPVWQMGAIEFAAFTKIGSPE